MSVRGVPAQDLPENQDPDVAHSVDAMTGEKIPFGEERKQVEQPMPTEPTREKNPPKKKTDEK